MGEVRTKFLDFDARRDPKTSLYCVRCQKDIKGNPALFVHVVSGGSRVLHPDDEAAYVACGPHRDDLGAYPIGTDCARKIGLEWCRP